MAYLRHEMLPVRAYPTNLEHKVERTGLTVGTGSAKGW
jgi:hypothetical protein